MVKDIRILIQADCYGWFNNFKYNKQIWRKSLLKLFGYIIIVLALSFLGFSLFSHLRSFDAPSKLLLNVINGFLLFGVLIVAKELMESSLKILFEAPDTTILHAAPIQPVAIFGYKFVHIIATRFLSILCFLSPPWVVFGVIYKLPWHFYITLLPISICLLVMIGSYVTISMMVIARFFASSKLLSIIKIVGTALSVSVGFLLSFSLFIGTDEVPIKKFLLNWATSKTGETTAIRFPHEWIGQMLISINTNSSTWDRFSWGIAVYGFTVLSIGITLLTAHLFYKRGWENVRQLKSKRRSPRKSTISSTELNSVVVAIFRGRIQSMMLKDFMIYMKHTGRVIAIIMLTLFLIVHILVLWYQGNVSESNASEILTVQIVLYSLLITFGISCNGLRDEIKTWWMLKTAPVSPKLIFTSKFLTALLCAVIYAEFWSLAAIFLLNIPTDNRLFILLTPIISLPVGCVLNTMIGTLPWMAELNNQPKTFLRVLSFSVTLLIDVAFVIIPVIAWYSNNLYIFLLMVFLLIIVFVSSYIYGLANVRKLLVAQ
ncbi:hypothetical protein JT359_04280 [Candidatus Poribacteria bacterium]|nr:hypothetical protein [Candidatus Poribacteria bacterium]